MTALVILAVSLISLFSLRNRDIVLSAKASHVIEATLLARRKIAEFSLNKKEESRVSEIKCDVEEAVSRYRCEWEVKPTLYPQVRELIVRVLWSHQGYEEVVQLTKYLFDQT